MVYELGSLPLRNSLSSEMMASQSKQAVPIGPGVIATWKVPFAKIHGFRYVIEITLILAKEVAISIGAHSVVEWIMAKFNGRSEKVIINRKECTFDHGELTKIVEETITYERNRSMR